MNRYQAPTPRPAIAFASVVMAALTFALFVVAPGHLNSGRESTAAGIASVPTPREAIEVVISPSRIQVVGERVQNTAFEPIPQTHGQQQHAS